MNGSKISIIVPVYKVEKYIEECFASLANQTYQNIEIILVDDGSPDKSGFLCDEFAAERSDTIVIHQENAGVSVARNNGINLASGDYILFVDPDDSIEKDCCERLIECVSQNDYDIIFFLDKELNDLTGKKICRELSGSMELNREDIKRLQYNTIGMNYRLFQFHSGTPWGKLFKKEFIQKNNLRFTPGVVKAQDVLFDTQAYERLDQAYVLNYSGYIYRKNEGSSNLRFNPGIVNGTFLLIEGLGRIADLHPDDLNYQKSMAKTCMRRVNFIERLYLFNRNHVCTAEESLRIYQEYLSLPTVTKYLKYYEKNDTDGFRDAIRRCLFNKKTLKLYYYILVVRYGVHKNY